MELNNPLYKNQGIHVIASIFTVEKGITKVLLIRRKNQPYMGKWALVGGALYNNEELLDGAKREIFEKTGIKDIDLYYSNIFSKVNRSLDFRMIAVSYIGVIDHEKVNVLKETLKTTDSDWFSITNIPELAYDHNEILGESLKTLQEKIMHTNILKALFPNGFTIPEIHKTCEIILGKELDRRNFRKKLLLDNLVCLTNRTKKFEGNKPANIYKFK